jgi:hypothetical protein
MKGTGFRLQTLPGVVIRKPRKASKDLHTEHKTVVNEQLIFTEGHRPLHIQWGITEKGLYNSNTPSNS